MLLHAHINIETELNLIVVEDYFNREINV
jgi:hypothetical protein